MVDFDKELIRDQPIIKEQVSALFNGLITTVEAVKTFPANGLEEAAVKIHLHPLATPYEDGYVDDIVAGKVTVSEVFGIGRKTLLEPEKHSRDTLKRRALEIALLSQISHHSTRDLFNLTMQQLDTLLWAEQKEQGERKVYRPEYDGWGVLTNAYVHSNKNLAPVNRTGKVELFARVITTIPSVFHSVLFTSTEGKKHGWTQECLEIFPNSNYSTEGWDEWFQFYLMRNNLPRLQSSLLNRLKQ